MSVKKINKYPKVKLSDLRTINSRIRRERKRGDVLSTTHAILARANQLGYKTQSGYLSKSKKAQFDPNLREAIDWYKNEYQKEKVNRNYRMEEDFKAIIKNLMTDSEFRVLAEESESEDVFVDVIINLVEEYHIWDEDYQDKFTDWLKDEYKKYHRGRWT